jgi:hypothetical protein
MTGAVSGKVEFETNQMPENERGKASHHLFGAACSLFGLCFILINIINHFGIPDETILDKLAAVAALLFLASGVFSYVSLRITGKGFLYDRMAEIFFGGGILFLGAVALAVIFGKIK